MSEKHLQPTDQLWAREVNERVLRLELKIDRLIKTLYQLFTAVEEEPIENMKDIHDRFLRRLKALAPFVRLPADKEAGENE